MQSIENIDEAIICIEDMIRELEHIHDMQIEIQDTLADMQEFLNEMKER